MKSLYLLLNIGSLSIPFLYSFHPKMNFKKHWKALSISTLIVAVLFITWDYFFTKNGIWGFNDKYHLGVELLGMPFEEILFFFCIPYASIFVHYSVLYFKPSWALSLKNTRIISLVLMAACTALILAYQANAYSLVVYSVTLFTLALAWFKGLQLLQTFYISFLFILIPFFMVNGILTGSFITEEVVWYNNSENIGLRLFTIPVEDIAYAFSMIFMNLMLMNYLKESK